MVLTSGRDKIYKHYIPDGKFELDHHSDYHYPSVEPHYHEFYELLYFVSGHVDYIIGDEIYHLQNDDLLVIPPNVIHNPVFSDFDVPYERFVLWVSLSTLQALSSIDDELGYFLQPDAPKFYLLRRRNTAWGNFRTIFASLEENFHTQSPLRHAQMKAFLIHLFVEYDTALMSGTNTAQRGERDSLLTTYLHYIQEHIAEDLSLDKIANDFLIDKYNFSHQFKNKMGVPYYKYVLQQRLLMGKNLLLENQPANTVCFQCGFHDYSSFYRAFKKEYHVSPTDFKRLHK